MDLAQAESWISENANLLSGLAGMTTLVSFVAAPMLRRRHQTPSKAPGQAIADAPAQSIPATPAQPVPSAPPASGPGGIAVMPFDSLSSDAGDGHIADGISCEIISALGRAGYRHVAPRSDSFALRGKALPLAEIARQLSVRYVVHGNLRHDADRLRVIAEFADSSTGRQLWSKTYERPFADVLQVQEEIAQAIAGSLGGETLRAEVLNLAPSTSNTTAWGLLQKARHIYLTAVGSDSAVRALVLARQAVAADPNYAVAHAMVAQLQADLVSVASASDTEQSKTEARASIEHALSLASRDPEVLMFAGRVWVELGERERSVVALRQATILAPYDLIGWGWLARSLAFGEPAEAAEAVTVSRRIVEIAPEHPSAWSWELFEGLALMNLERYPEALTLLRKSIGMSPKFARGLMALAAALGACDLAEEARAVVARSLAVNPNLKPERFVDYVRTLSASAETTGRILLGFSRANLLAA